MSKFLIIVLLLAALCAHAFSPDVSFTDDPTVPSFAPETQTFHQLVNVPLFLQPNVTVPDDFCGAWAFDCEPYQTNFSVQSSLEINGRELHYIQKIYAGDKCVGIGPASGGVSCGSLCNTATEGQLLFEAWVDAEIVKLELVDTVYQLDLRMELFIIQGETPAVCTGVFLDNSTIDITHGACGNWWAGQEHVYTTLVIDGTRMEFAGLYTPDPRGLYASQSQPPGSQPDSRLQLYAEYARTYLHKSLVSCKHHRFRNALVWVDLGKGYKPNSPSDFGTCATFFPPLGMHDLAAFVNQAPIATAISQILVNPSVGAHTDFKPYGVYSPLPLNSIVSWVSLLPSNRNASSSPMVQFSVDATLQKLQQCSRLGISLPLVTVRQSADGVQSYSFCVSVNFLFAGKTTLEHRSASQCMTLVFDDDWDYVPHNNGGDSDECNGTLTAAFFAHPMDYWSQRILDQSIHYPPGSDITLGVRACDRKKLTQWPIKIYNVAICRVPIILVDNLTTWLASNAEAGILCPDAPASYGVIAGQYFLKAGIDTRICPSTHHGACVAQMPKVADTLTNFTCHAPNHLHVCRKEPAFAFNPLTEYNNNQYVGCDGISLNSHIILTGVGALTDSSETYVFSASIIAPSLAPIPVPLPASTKHKMKTAALIPSPPPSPSPGVDPIGVTISFTIENTTPPPSITSSSGSGGGGAGSSGGNQPVQVDVTVIVIREDGGRPGRGRRDSDDERRGDEDGVWPGLFIFWILLVIVFIILCIFCVPWSWRKKSHASPPPQPSKTSTTTMEYTAYVPMTTRAQIATGSPVSSSLHRETTAMLPTVTKRRNQ